MVVKKDMEEEEENVVLVPYYHPLLILLLPLLRSFFMGSSLLTRCFSSFVHCLRWRRAAVLYIFTIVDCRGGREHKKYKVGAEKTRWGGLNAMLQLDRQEWEKCEGLQTFKLLKNVVLEIFVALQKNEEREKKYFRY